MPEPAISSLAFDPAVLTRAVCAALGSDTIAIERWQVRPAGASAGAATAGVYRVSGTADDRGALVQWAIMLKVIRPAAAAWNPAARAIDHPNLLEARGAGLRIRPARRPAGRYRCATLLCHRGARRRVVLALAGGGRRSLRTPLAPGAIRPCRSRSGPLQWRLSRRAATPRLSLARAAGRDAWPTAGVRIRPGCGV